MAIPAELLEIIRCPECGSTLVHAENADGTETLSSECGLVFPVVDDIPVLLVDEAVSE